MLYLKKTFNYLTFHKSSIANKESYVRRHILLNIVFNIVLNAALPYFALRQYTHIPLYGGRENVVLYILPMFFILPFLVTLVVLTQTLFHSQKGNVQMDIPQHNTGKWFRLKLGFINGIVSISIAAIVLLAFIYINRQANVPVFMVVFISSFSSAVLSYLFIKQAIAKLQKS